MKGCNLVSKNDSSRVWHERLCHQIVKHLISVSVSKSFDKISVNDDSRKGGRNYDLGKSGNGLFEDANDTALELSNSVDEGGRRLRNRSELR